MATHGAKEGRLAFWCPTYQLTDGMGLARLAYCPHADAARGKYGGQGGDPLKGSLDRLRVAGRAGI